jgi:hypothetical protein
MAAPLGAMFQIEFFNSIGQVPTLAPSTNQSFVCKFSERLPTEDMWGLYRAKYGCVDSLSPGAARKTIQKVPI